MSELRWKSWPAQPRGRSVSQSSLISARNIHRTYTLGKKTVEVLRGIDLEIGRGERVFLCGASGAGKTTLLYTLAGLERPERGRVHIEGADLYSLSQREQSRVRNSKMGYIFQNYYLLPELTALENVMVPGMIRSKNHRRQAMALLDEVGLGGRVHHLPAELSGGEQQKACVARALIKNPKIIVADEPTGNLDPSSSDDIIDLLESESKSGTTIIMATHNYPLIENRIKHFIELNNGKLVS